MTLRIRKFLARMFIDIDWLALFHAGVLSVFLSMATICGSIYFELISDKLFASKSIETLVILTSTLVFILAFVAILEKLRGEILYRYANLYTVKLSKEFFNYYINKDKHDTSDREFYGYVLDLHIIRNFFIGKSLTAIYDAGVIPVYVWVLFQIDYRLGIFSAVLLLITFLLVVMVEMQTKNHELELHNKLNDEITSAQEIALKIGSLAVLGSKSRLKRRWMSNEIASSSAIGNKSIISVSIDIIYQFFGRIYSASILAFALWLVIEGQMSPGNSIGCMLLAGKITMQLSLLTSQWNEITKAYRSRLRLVDLMNGNQPKSNTNDGETISIDKSATARREFSGFTEIGF